MSPRSLLFSPYYDFCEGDRGRSSELGSTAEYRSLAVQHPYPDGALAMDASPVISALLRLIAIRDKIRKCVAVQPAECQQWRRYRHGWQSCRCGREFCTRTVPNSNSVRARMAGGAEHSKIVLVCFPTPRPREHVVPLLLTVKERSAALLTAHIPLRCSCSLSSTLVRCTLFSVHTFGRRA